MKRINYLKFLTGILILSSLLTGCYDGPDPVKFFGKSKTASIELYLDGTSTFQLAYTDDPETIKKWAGFITKEKTPAYKCGYDGRIVFSKSNANYDVNFNLDDTCLHVAYIIDDALYTRKLSKEGQQFISEKINAYYSIIP